MQRSGCVSFATRVRFVGYSRMKEEGAVTIELVHLTYRMWQLSHVRDNTDAIHGEHQGSIFPAWRLVFL